MALTPEMEKYYDRMDEMFGTAGWRTLVDEMKKRVYELQAEALDASTWAAVCEKRGEAKSLAYLANLEEINDLNREQLEVEEEEETVDAYV